jgi:hypothetical protein
MPQFCSLYAVMPYLFVGGLQIGSIAYFQSTMLLITPSDRLRLARSDACCRSNTDPSTRILTSHSAR